MRRIRRKLRDSQKHLLDAVQHLVQRVGEALQFVARIQLLQSAVKILLLILRAVRVNASTGASAR